jgi:hypothetical protein
MEVTFNAHDHKVKHVWCKTTSVYVNQKIITVLNYRVDLASQPLHVVVRRYDIWLKPALIFSEKVDDSFGEGQPHAKFGRFWLEQQVLYRCIGDKRIHSKRI